MKIQPPQHVDATILIVDDNPANVELLLALLEDNGYQFLESLTDPRQVEARVRQQKPDLILLDVRMPYLNGFEVMERLQALLGKVEAPAIIVLTAQTDTETRYRALALGARDFLIKPFDHLEVLQRINNVLQLQKLITERNQRARQLESVVAERTAELQVLSFQDPLTGLPNRVALLEQLNLRIQQEVPTDIFFMALAGVDEVARLHGFTIADQLLVAVADRLLQQMQVHDCTLGIWNSTEWVLLCTGEMTEAFAGLLAAPLLAAFSVPFEIEQMVLYLNVRIGVSASLEGRTADQLIRMAALALPPGDGLWRGYDQALELLMKRQNGMRSALRGAVVRGEFYLVYQPKVSLRNGQLFGAEALLRWDSPIYGRVSPVEFIPLAEASGEIFTLGAWVIEQSIDALTRWREHQRVSETFSLAVNVASMQLMCSDFAPWLIERVGHSALRTALLEIEVTESGLMQDMKLAMRQLGALSKAGFSIAIDDFGTGYSSLAYLKNLPVSVLKIDRAFISELHTRAEDQRLAGTVIDMARHFNFLTVAEGVEQEAQLKRLMDMGCDLVQGYFFAPPLKEDALLKLAFTGFAHLPCFSSR